MCSFCTDAVLSLMKYVSNFMKILKREELKKNIEFSAKRKFIYHRGCHR
jgi:hypothetical protein